MKIYLGEGETLEELQKRCSELAAHFSGLIETNCVYIMTSPMESIVPQPGGYFCADCTCKRCTVLNTHLYGCNESYRWNGRYIYYCPLGLVFAASSVSDGHGTLVGGLIAGPIVMGVLQDTLSDLADFEMTEKISALPILSTARVNHLAEVLASATANAAGMPHSLLGSFVYEQEKMLNMLYDIKDRFPEAKTDSQYLINSEKQLHELIKNKDKSGAQMLLNEMLGYIYFFNDYNINFIKVRLIELAVLLSRASIDAGADMNEILLFNSNYLQKIEQFTAIEELSVWITGIMHRFINYAFDFTLVKHSDVVHKVMEYVKSNYNKKITLDDIAQHVYLSRSYLSSMFKEETGGSLFSYINDIRIEKSKQFLLDDDLTLLDITGLCGFEDQSYFTKVFKKSTGISPKKFRNSRGNMATAKTN